LIFLWASEAGFKRLLRRVFFQIDSILKPIILQASIRISSGLFATEIYANWVRKEELERWV
jgi:hypothetical protein